MQAGGQRKDTRTRYRASALGQGLAKGMVAPARACYVARAVNTFVPVRRLRRGVHSRSALEPAGCGP